MCVCVSVIECHTTRLCCNKVLCHPSDSVLTSYRKILSIKIKLVRALASWAPRRPWCSRRMPLLTFRQVPNLKLWRLLDLPI